MYDNSTTDEETALLPRNTSEGQHSPIHLPKAQIGIVLLLRLCEPIASRSISPYINQLISELDITGGDERKVGYYAGLIQSLFYLSQAVMVMQWSRLSDRVGRKPVLLFGLVGAALSMLLFGLSRTFWTLVVSRCLYGLFNGNTCVMKSVIGDLTDSSNRAQAFSFLAVIRATGSSLGPLIGGSFSRPHERFPAIFTGQFWIDYPYFLPCVAVCSFIGFAFIVALFLLKETAPRHHEGASSPYIQSSKMPVTLRGLLIYPVLISVSSHAVLAFLDIMLGALMPLFFAMPIEIGGLGFEPSTIGYIMGMYGLGNGIFQASCFAPIVRQFGARSIFIKGIICFIPIYMLFPLMNIIARRSGVNVIIWSIIALMMSLMSFMDMAYGCIFMYITASSPNKHSLGATNGLSQTSVSLARTLGPIISTSLFALSAEKNILGGYAVYVILVLVSCLAILPAVRLPEQMWEEKQSNEAEQLLIATSTD
ncbi:major facilitator superfamily domain-containing protein [Infundibulicybe gibba]|nr:major facilitator superfamily domain-containing protein [Infundibulicybe gibba]